MKSRVFVTGASGYLGSAIAARLLRDGYQVFGLTRSSRHAERLDRAGIRPIIGDLARPETFLGALKNCDAAVHASYTNEGPPAVFDELALEAFAEAAEDGRLRRLLYTSGVWVHGDTGDRVVDELAPLAPLELVAWRAAHEEVVMDLAQHEVVPVVFRPGIVYGESRGIVGGWFREARERGTVTVYGTGEQHWALVHRDDVAAAYALALERASGGERYLLADGSSFTAREIAGAVARASRAAVRAWPAEEVVGRFGLLGKALLASERVSAARARRELGWTPRHTNFVAEAEALCRESAGQREAKVA